jgi:agmatine/peptidylarginine deiminase
MCSDQDGENAVRTWLTNNKFTITPYLEFVHIDPVDIWQRDFGPIFLRNSSNTLAMASFLRTSGDIPPQQTRYQRPWQECRQMSPLN